MTLLVFIVLCFSLIQIGIYRTQLSRSAAHAVFLTPDSLATNGEGSKVSVIIPAYNEADNIQDCLMSVLNSTDLCADQLEVWMVDDQSSDETLKSAERLQQTLSDPRLHILPGQPRPISQPWTGKNWACTQAVEQTTGEFLLFLDADVRLKPGAIEAALRTAQTEQIDLLSSLPGVLCHSWGEWAVQRA